MGCGGGKETTNVDKGRRRLSVGQVDTSAASTGDDPATQEDRGLLSSLPDEALLTLVQQDEGGRKMSIGSQTDQSKTSFANKSIAQVGDEIDSSNSGLGYTCRKGLKPEAPNQDSWFILQTSNFSIYGVFDGHGQKGHDISNFVKDNLPKLILKDERLRTENQPQMLKDVFKKCQALVSTADRMKKLSAQMSGTTATVCIHDKKDEKSPQGSLCLAHVADSTAVIARVDPKSRKLAGVALTRDHKPNLKDERQRIEKAGGRVVFDGYANHRVYAKNARYPGLNMSRCLGDLMGHLDCGVTAEPEVSTIPITEDDRHLLLCSDGVWEFMAAQEAVDLVDGYVQGENGRAQAMKAAEALAKDAWDRWIKEEGGAVVDDITVVLVLLA